MAAPTQSDARLRSRILAAMAVGLVCALTLAACDDAEPETPGEPRVDSTVRFEGEQREVAATLEAFERAVLADDVGRICRQLLLVRESRDPDNDNGGRRFCAADPANGPARELRRAGGEERYDVLVRRIELKPRPRRSTPRPRRAVALVDVGARSETFLLGA
jgi:hypothetical protein